MSNFGKGFRLVIICFVLLVIANGIPDYSGEYNEERFINYDKPVSQNNNSKPGNEEKVLAMTSEQVAAMWQLEVFPPDTPEEIAAQKAAAAKQVAQDWQLVVGDTDEAWGLQVNLNGRRPF